MLRRSSASPPWPAILAALLLAAVASRAPRPPAPAIRLLDPPPSPSPPAPIDLGPLGPLLLSHARAAPPSFAELPALRVFNALDEAHLRLYAPDGSLDPQALDRLDHLLADARRPGKPPEIAPIDRRLLQLVFKAAYHFGAEEIEVVSGYRKPRRFAEGLHAKARAIDFRLVGVDAPEVAVFFRQHPRVGVGLYTHPRTRWIHLDTRDRSYHWIDATPPGRRWGEARLPAAGLDELDASYNERDDLPEVIPPE